MAMIRQRAFTDVRVTAVRRARCSTTFAHAPAAAPGIGVGAIIAGRLEWARAAVEAYGLIGLPAAILSRSHRLAAANELMKKLIPHAVQDRPSRIGLADRRADAILAQVLSQMQGCAAGQARAVPIPATPELPASIVHVIPVSGAANGMLAAASCMLVIAAVARPEIASARLLADLFDLTPAEARVARGIAAGKTVHDLAEEAGLAAGTIRQQLKSVFSKTGVSRQADLVGLLVGSALSFPGNALPQISHSARKPTLRHRRVAGNKAP
jgi:DNA-binding CsgD family transcriptional regulator